MATSDIKQRDGKARSPQHKTEAGADRPDAISEHGEKGKAASHSTIDDKSPRQKPKEKNSTASWIIKIFFLSMLLSALMSFASSEVLEGAGLALAFGVLAFFIVLGILFDIIGVAVTAADERPFHSMATHRIPGAKEAINLIRKADKVSSFCNDVVGDICGIVSGTTAAVIVLRIQETLSFQSVLISLAITALTSGLTIGGKAIGKSFAIAKSTSVLHLVGRFLHLFSRKKR